jgi:hypothetical protein
MKVFIYSIHRPSAVGLDKWIHGDSNVNLKKNKIGKATDKLQCLENPKVGGLATGLYKPWIDEKTGTQKVDKDGKPLTMQDKMEQKWNLPKGYLHNRPYRKGMKLSDLSYYMEKTWVLKDGSTCLDLDNMDDELGYYVFLEASRIANSEKELREHKWPKATHYIALENESEEIKFSKNEMKSKAIAQLHREDMTPTMKFKIAAILGLCSATSNLTQEQVGNLLFEFVNNSTFDPGSNIDKFNEVTVQLKTPVGRENLEARFLLKLAIDTRAIFEKQGAYTWPRPTGVITIGENYSEAIDFFMNPKKAALIDDLKAEIDLRK